MTTKQPTKDLVDVRNAHQRHQEMLQEHKDNKWHKKEEHSKRSSRRNSPPITWV